MDWVRPIAATAAVASLVCWALLPARIDPKPFAALTSAPTRAIPGPAELWRARLANLETLAVFSSGGAGGAPNMELSSLVLKGTAVSPARQAALIAAGGERPVWIGLGEAIGDFELVAIKGSSAVLRDGGGTEMTLQIFSTGRAGSDRQDKDVLHDPA